MKYSAAALVSLPTRRAIVRPFNAPPPRRNVALRTCCKSTTLATQILSGKLLSTDHNKDIEINVARRLLYMAFHHSIQLDQIHSHQCFFTFRVSSKAINLLPKRQIGILNCEIFYLSFQSSPVIGDVIVVPNVEVQNYSIVKDLGVNFKIFQN